MEFAKYAKYTLLGIMGISLIFILWFYLGGVVVPGAAKPEPVATSSILRFAYILTIVPIIAALLFSIFNVASDMKKVKSFAIVLVIAAILFVFARILSSGEVLNLIGYDGEDNVPHILKNVGTGLISTYILLGTVVVAIIYLEVAKLFK